MMGKGVDGQRVGTNIGMRVRSGCILIGVIVCTLPWSGTSAAARAQPSHHGVHPMMPGQAMVVQCRLPDVTVPSWVDTALRVDGTGSEGRTDQKVLCPAPAPPLVISRYLGRAVLEQKVVESSDAHAPPAVELHIEGPTQSFHRWLVAGDAERNRLLSYIGTWRYMSVADQGARDQLFSEFETEFTRDPMLLISRLESGTPHRLPLALNESQEIKEWSYRMRVREFMPDYAMDRTTQKAANQSSRRRNPAALVELEHDGKTESRWIFAKYPNFAKEPVDALPIRVVLDCPAEGDAEGLDFALVTLRGDSHELWTRAEGQCTSRTLSVGESVQIPGSAYRFQIKSFVPQSKMIETYHADESRAATPAVELEFTAADGTLTQAWLALGHHRRLTTPTAVVEVSFSMQTDRPPALHP